MIFVVLKSNIVINKIQVADADKTNTDLLAEIKTSQEGADNIVEVPDGTEVEVGWQYDGSVFSKTDEMIASDAAADAVKIVFEKRLARLVSYDVASMTSVSELLPVLTDLMDQLLGKES